MPRVKTSAPKVDRQKNQRSISLPDFLARYVPAWTYPGWLDGELWRSVVRQQPFAMICRDTLSASLIALDWKIEPVDSDKRDEYKDDIKYYTDFFQDTGEYDYVDILEWINGDALDLPFGGACELGWEGDTPPSENPDSRLLWIELLDGATLFPYPNRDWPVGQYVKEAGLNTVYFPDYAINRLFISPRSEIKRKGWGMPPPEKIYLGLEMLNRGDRYYANLLLDTPEVGILDLGDIEESSAKEWIKSWKELLVGIDPFKIPVLYGHEKPASFVSFTRSPTELVFDRTIVRYESLVAAGYGMSLSDVGIQVSSSGGDTMAGSIRQERKTRRTGFARMKKKNSLFFNRMLPPHLRFHFIDLDDELSVALGRARLANATAWSQMIDKKMFTPSEARQQTVADGLTSISLPENVDEKEFDILTPPMLPGQQPFGKSPERPGMLGKPVPPSSGGHGEVKASRVEVFDLLMEKDSEFREVVEEIDKSWDTLSINQKATISDELDKCLTIDEA